MKSLVLNLSFCLTSLYSLGQDTLNLTIVRSHSSTFEIDGQSIKGRGWDFLRDELQTTQFVVLGENHYSPLLSVFTTHLLTTASAEGFKHFLLETGPVAAKKITALYSPDEKIYQQRVHDFLTRFKLQAGAPPSEFITMKNDIPMLQAAIRNKFKVAGLDKEYYSSIDYLLYELGQFATTRALKNKYAAALKSAEIYKSKELLNNNYPYITHCASDTAIGTFLNQISTQNSDARELVDEMRKTFTIYALYEDKKYYLSEQTRTNNIKQNFGRLYSHHKGDPGDFKAIVKIGNMHSQRGVNFQGIYDIGNTVAEVATLNGKTSTHIYCMRRFRKNATGQVSDFYNDGYEVYPNFIALTDSTKWVLVDLRSLRIQLMSRVIKVKNKEEKDLIMQNDLLLLIPVDGAFKESLNYE